MDLNDFRKELAMLIKKAEEAKIDKKHIGEELEKASQRVLIGGRYTGNGPYED